MFGTVICNKHLKELIVNNIVTIEPFYENRMKVAHYPLYPEAIYKIDANGKKVIEHELSIDENPFHIKGNEYRAVKIRELIKLPEGIFGQFIPSSNLIEQGLTITAGKIEYPYGQDSERIFFGVKNNLDYPVELSINQYIAWVQLFDLRGTDRNRFELTERDKKVYSDRKD